MGEKKFASEDMKGAYSKVISKTLAAGKKKIEPKKPLLKQVKIQEGEKNDDKA